MYNSLPNITLNLTRLLAKSINKKIHHTRNVKILSNMITNINSFEGVEDRYRGITVDSKLENCSAQEFSNKLSESLKNWIINSKRGIWFKVATENADWVPILTTNGFNFHHAKPGYVMMYRWLPENESDHIPSYAHTMLAVGSVVTNDRNQVLVVKEKYFITSHWKFPGGIVDPGENLIPASIREVKEETNIDTVFDSFLSIRHAHKGMFDCSDLYMVISLKALNEDVRHCPREIQAAKWMDIQEFMNSDDVSELNKGFMQSYLHYKEKNIKIDCKSGFHQFLKKHYVTYSAVCNEENNT